MHTLETALETLTDTAARLEVEGYPQAVIADAFLSAGLSIGSALQGPDATARVLRQLAQRFTGEAVKQAVADQPTDEPETRVVWEAMTTAALTLKEQGISARQIAEAAAIYGLSMAEKQIGREALAAWLEDWSHRLTSKEPPKAPTQH